MASRLVSSEETFRSELREALGESDGHRDAAAKEGARRGEAKRVIPISKWWPGGGCWGRLSWDNPIISYKKWLESPEKPRGFYDDIYIYRWYTKPISKCWNWLVVWNNQSTIWWILIIGLVVRLHVWNMNFMTFHILGIIIPTDFHIFQRGRSTTNQGMLGLLWDIIL